MASLKQRISNLLTVKSLVTFALTGAFVYLSVTDKVKPDIFIPIYSSVISFYFGTQLDKRNDNHV